MQAIVALVWRVVGVGSASLSHLAFPAVMAMVSVLDGMATEVKMDRMFATGGEEKIVECGWTDKSSTVKIVRSSAVAVVAPGQLSMPTARTLTRATGQAWCTLETRTAA